eukprot:CAMPEP_0202505648 /NCGR_PEP_ID=MMETSP1361-20130828/47741_1 /ASSEMBLY_ACC=CAM_ASM_000849 /TAXON_ID=210615 /ORGANISM="Staurosira complex sp., Strain CCMP2646" /LENGTH=31 /DNA_ID= /DNA_START= /DNA_END= /DNA_ORIENTATION=
MSPRLSAGVTGGRNVFFALAINIMHAKFLVK